MESRVEARHGRTLRQLVGPVGSDYLRRALPPTWVWAVLALLLALALHGTLPALAATAVIGSAVVVHWPRRGLLWPGHWRMLGLLVLGVAAWVPEPDVLSDWFEHGLSVALLSLSAVSVLAYVLQARRLAVRLQAAADTMDEQRLLQLLPEEAAAHALRWRDGDDSRAQELAVVMHLAVMHAALAPQVRRAGRQRRV